MIGTKAVLAFLRTRSLIIGNDLFPPNPHPGSQNKITPETALSATEQAALARAVKTDLIAIHNESFLGSESHLITVLMVSIAMRTGLNTEPLSPPRDPDAAPSLAPGYADIACLQMAWPLNADQGVAWVDRYRSQQIATRRGICHYRNGIATYGEFRGRGGGGIQESIVAITDRAPLSDNGRPIPMTAEFGTCLRRLVARHDLRDDVTGEPLVLNTSRLRKTVEGRYWRITGRNLFQVAQVMQQTPAVADRSYLHATAEMEKKHVFLGQALVQKWRADSAKLEEAVAPMLYSAPQNMTPVARCEDPCRWRSCAKEWLSLHGLSQLLQLSQFCRCRG